MDAVNRMKNGCILNGGVGSGKSRTGLYYYFKEQGGSIIDRKYVKMRNPITKEVVERPLSFRIPSIIQAMQVCGSDEYDDGYDDED